MLGVDDPLFANWNQDATAEAEADGAQDPDVVATQLWDDAQSVAARFNGLDDTHWERAGRRSDGSSFTVLSLGQYFCHDLVHHVSDVTGEQQDLPLPG